jgi:RNA polymerase sigma-70 factor (ECF subfamily)
MTAGSRKAERIAAFEEVVSRYEAALLRYAARILHSDESAQDVVQEVFLKAYRSWKGELAPSPHLSNWLYRVTHNQAVDQLRKESRRRLLHLRHSAEQPEFVPPDRGAGLRVSEAAVRAAAALRALSLREQQLVILKVYEEKSYKEISAITGLTVSNVGYILHHAMKKLAAALHDRGEPGDGPPA